MGCRRRRPRQAPASPVRSFADRPPAVPCARASGSGREAWSGDCRAAGGPRRSTPPRRAECSSSGSPDQITTSPRRPAARLPISPPRPTASAGREVIIANASPQLTPAAPGTLPSATRLPAYCRWLRTVARVIVVDHADRDLDPRGAHPADVRLGRGQHFEAGRQVVERRGDHPHARRGDPVGDQSSLRSRRPARS